MIEPTTRELVLQMVKDERKRQVSMYGNNDDLEFGFGPKPPFYPWLSPYNKAESDQIEGAFRQDYEAHENQNGKPSWMHLIREEVAELFDARTPAAMMDEAVQVAALCVSMVEQILAKEGVG